ncbi:MAG: Panacea domain-containing protein [Microcystaceae cyanobacterium]
MATSHDVATYILNQKSPITAIKLQKLVYYAQAWSLVWDEKPLFQERIEAWANGPVIPELYECHRGQFEVESLSVGDPDNLTNTQKETIDEVLNFYGDKSSQWLSELTHKEMPWIQARQGLAPGERGNQEITLDSMAEYYGSLV